MYAQYQVNYVVVFDFRNGTKTTKTVTYGKSYGTLPSAGEKTGYTFTGWFTEEEERITEETIVSIGSDHTLYARWTINNYTITFIFNNGTENDVRVLNFNETIVYPENPTKEWHTFNGWSPRPERMPADDVTVTAHWTENPTEYVEIVFSKEGLKKEEIREIIGEYTQEEFSIKKIEIDEEIGGTKAIVKFADKEKAASFSETVKTLSDAKNTIKKISFLHGEVESLSILCAPDHLSFGLFV